MYDYWADVTDTDLHPVGYTMHKGVEIQGPRGKYKIFLFLSSYSIMRLVHNQKLVRFVDNLK